MIQRHAHGRHRAKRHDTSDWRLAHPLAFPQKSNDDLSREHAAHHGIAAANLRKIAVFGQETILLRIRIFFRRLDW